MRLTPRARARDAPTVLIIRKSQEEALAAARVDDFARRASNLLEDAFPTATRALGREALEARVRQAVERCEARSIVNETSVYRYLEWTFVLGEGFDDEDGPYPWAASILDDTSLGEDARLKGLARAAARFTTVAAGT
jgi:hypothetical protein